MSDDPFASASAYRAKGWVGALPLPYAKKSPPPKGFTGEDGAWPTPGDLARWSEAGPQNIALRLPPNVIALDVDDPEAFLVLVELLGALPPTWRSQGRRTRLGHMYYRLPAGVTSTGWSDPCEGAELLRFGHRYSLVAPSVHDEEPVRYRWMRPDGTESGTDLPGPGELPELPPPWVDYLSGEVDETVAPGPSKPERDDFGPITHNHDDTLSAYAAHIVGLYPGITLDHAVDLVVARGQDCVPSWASGMRHGDKTLEAAAREDWVPSALRKFGREPDPIWPAYEAALEALVASGPITAEVIASGEAFPIVDWNEAWQAPEEEDWILEPLIAANRGIALYSAPKVGKSILMLEIAVAISQGKPVLGITPPRPRKVLYVDHENDLRGDVVRRLRNMGLVPGDLGGLRYLNLPVMTSLDEPRGGAELLAVAEREGAELVVIDTVSRAISGEENANDTWLAFYRHTGKALKAAGIACVRLDHSGKDETRGQRGASAKSGDVDAVWQLTKPGPNDFLLFCEAQRMGIPEDARSIAFRRLDEPHLRHERAATPTRLNQEAKRLRALWLALDEAGLSIDPLDDRRKPRSGYSIENELKAAGIPFSKGLAKSVVVSRWEHLNNAFCPPPPYMTECLSTEGDETVTPPYPPTSPDYPPTSPGGGSIAPSSPHCVAGGAGEVSPRAETT